MYQRHHASACSRRTSCWCVWGRLFSLSRSSHESRQLNQSRHTTVTEDLWQLNLVKRASTGRVLLTRTQESGHLALCDEDQERWTQQVRVRVTALMLSARTAPLAGSRLVPCFVRLNHAKLMPGALSLIFNIELFARSELPTHPTACL